MRRLLVMLPLLSCATARLTETVRLSTPPRRLALASMEPRRTLVVDGVTLALHDSAPDSARPVLLCLHAIGHGGGDFAPVVKAFSNDFRVITLDWPGQGASGDDVQPASAVRYTTLLEGVVQQLGVTKLVLLGNSIGGAVAIEYASRHSEQVRALIIANPGGLDPGGFIAKLFIGNLEAHFHDGVEGLASFKPWFAKYYDGILVTDAAKARKALIVEAGWESAPILEQAWHSFAQPEADLRAKAKTLAMPVFVAWAAKDELIQWGRNREAVESIPNVKVVHFEAGHSPFLEAPETFTTEAKAFLSRLP
jgi:pimeloyl-ACP methyl ester carboxylesterase